MHMGHNSWFSVSAQENDKIIDAFLDVSLDIEKLRREKVHSKGNSKLI